MWTKKVDDVPEMTISRITLISGLLLPIWDRLPTDNMRIYRLQTHDGERRGGFGVVTAVLSFETIEKAYYFNS